MSQHDDRTAALRVTIERTIAPLLADRPRVALLDFPNHANVGDSAIWLGELSLLRALGLEPPCYTCDLDTYDEGQLRRRLRTGTILIHGGGNLGDLWKEHHDFRERIIKSFPHNPVIQLPQSIWFQDVAARARTRAIFDAHPNLTLLVREEQSLEIARNEFRSCSLLCPDLALHLGALAPPSAPAVPVLWLARTDREALHRQPSDVPGLVVDWLNEPWSLLDELNGWLGRSRYGARVLRRWLSATYEPLAQQRLRRGCALLSKGRVVVTDRLHGHILCLLLGISHVLLDNSYGKLSSFYRTWTSDFDSAHFAESPEDALALATRAAQMVTPAQP